MAVKPAAGIFLRAFHHFDAWDGQNVTIRGQGFSWGRVCHGLSLARFTVELF
jgi:hypothetical protein